MKKIIFLLSALLLVGGSSFAQKKNVAKAKAKILQAEQPDYKGAKEAILLALKDSTTKNDAATWFVAGDVFNAIYADQQKIEWTQKKGDRALMASSIDNALKYYLGADSLDKLPNAKGKIAPKYHNKIVEKVKELQRGFTDGGSYYYELKDYKNALKFFDTYISFPNFSPMQGLGLEKDTLIPLITYYCGLCATQAEMPALAVKYYEKVKDTMDSKWIYSRLCDDYSQLKDTANMLRMFKLGTQKFPQESYYVRSLINYYINQNKMDEALTWINAAIDLEPKGAVLWNVKGRLLETSNIEEAKKCYQQSIDLDPNFAEALGNMGRIYYNKAVEDLTAINTIRDDKKYKQEKAKLKSSFQLPLPYFEKAYQLNPNERDYVIALRGIYYNLDMDAKYQEMDKKLKSM
ncbi:MAG TPA: tetratricopeptide repeat protein [Bacteroidales bacterium]|nr:tetratricopeptide repeat protein [Bacteroidales bacterium]